MGYFSGKMNCAGSEILPYLESNKLAHYSFMNAGKRRKSPGSKTKDSLLLTTIVIAREPAFVLSPSCHRPCKKGQMIPASAVGCIAEEDSEFGKPKSFRLESPTLFFQVPCQKWVSKSHRQHLSP